MGHRTAAWLAWSLWALSMALTTLSLLLLVLNSSHPEVPVYSFWAENVLFSVGYSTVGALIVPRMASENPIGWLFCAIGLLWAVIHFFWRVRRLHPTSGARIAPSWRSCELGILLALGPWSRPRWVLGPTIP
jgi:hypothetical protein